MTPFPRSGILYILLLASALLFGCGKAEPPAPAPAPAPAPSSHGPNGADGPDRIALLIGNNKYPGHWKLDNPGNDAEDYGAALQRAGFRVEVKTDLDQDAMLETVRAFGERAKSIRGVALFYFAGHGMELDGRNFLLPVNIKSDMDNLSLSMKGLDADRVVKLLGDAAGRINIAIFDMCRNRPGRGLRGDGEGGLARMDAAKGSLLAFATRFGAKARDGDGQRNSPYAKHLIAKLDTPNLSVTDYFNFVRQGVREDTGDAQIPEETSRLEGLAPPLLPGAAKLAPVAQAGESAEVVFWNSVKDSGKAEELKLYLERYPQGQFAALVRGRAKSLEGVALEREEARLQAEERQRLEKQKAGHLQRDQAMILISAISIHVEETRNILGIDLNLAVIQEQANRLVSVLENISDLSPYHAELKYLDFLYDQFKGMATNWTKKYEKRARKIDRADTAEAETRSDEVMKVFNDFLKKLGQPEILSPAKSFKAGQIIKDCGACPELVVIPAGSFEMGSNEGDADEKPVHSVRIAQAYALGKTEVTQGQWKALMGNNPSHFSQCGDDCPVEQVSWDDAQMYIKKLNEKTGKGYRLPSEAEWEYAARAGTRTKLPWGDDLNQTCGHANVADRKAREMLGRGSWTIHDCDDGVVETAPVGKYRANGFGLYDMIGNVWEWVEDCVNDSYKGAPSDGTVWKSGDCGRRALRGGAWNSSPQLARPAVRIRNSGEYRDLSNGFRVARMLP